MSDVVLTGLLATSWTQTAPQTALCVAALGVAVVAADIGAGWAQVFADPLTGGRPARAHTPIAVAMALLGADGAVPRASDVLRPHATQLAIAFLAAATFVMLLAAARRATAAAATPATSIPPASGRLPLCPWRGRRRAWLWWDWI